MRHTEKVNAADFVLIGMQRFNYSRTESNTLLASSCSHSCGEHTTPLLQFIDAF